MAEFLGNKGLYRLLENSEYDYVAFVMTKWHVHSFEAALMMLQDKENRRLKGIVIIKAHPVNGFLLDENSFSIDNAELYYSEEDEGIKDIIHSELCGLTYYLKLKKSDRSSFYFLRPTSFRYPVLGMVNKALHSNKKISFVKLDEGVGTYLNDSKSWLKSSLSENRGLKSKLRCYIRYFEELLLKEDKLKKVGQYIDGCLFKKEDGRCIVNEDVRDFYKKSLCQILSSEKSFSFDIAEKYIIINTQMPEEVFKSGSRVSKDILKRAVDIFSRYGYKVYVKPHPREKDCSCYEDMGAVVINEKLSQEAILASLNYKPAFIAGFFSTTLVTSSVIFDVRTISLDDIVNSQNEFLDDIQDTVNMFRMVFNNYVYFCKNFEDLEYICHKSAD